MSNPGSESQDIDLIGQRLRASRVAGIEVSAFVSEQAPDGSWPDINYADQGMAKWLTFAHLDRTMAMARKYGWLEDRGNTDVSLAAATQKALAYWLDHNFINKGELVPKRHCRSESCRHDHARSAAHRFPTGPARTASASRRCFGEAGQCAAAQYTKA